MSDLMGQVFNIQHFTTEDGPGVRTTVFLQGCPLKCLWCANPESQKAHRQLAHRAPTCIGCGTCIKTCQNQVLSVKDGAFIIDRERCQDCGSCVEVCPTKALFFYGEQKTVDQVFDEVMKDAGFYRDCDGGVTCSGGECMMQAEFVAELFKKCKEQGIHTTLDTCGAFSADKFKLVEPYVDLILFDLKAMDSAKHKEMTGFGNELILENLKQCVKSKAQVWIRIPIIPGYNDTEENLKTTAAFVKELDDNLHVDLLPYHRFGLGKYQMLNMEYKLNDVQTPDEETMNRYKQYFTDLNLDCSVS